MRGLGGVSTSADLFQFSTNKRDLRAAVNFSIKLVTPKEFLQIVGEIES
jgi:hypothetical protein